MCLIGVVFKAFYRNSLPRLSKAEATLASHNAGFDRTMPAGSKQHGSREMQRAMDLCMPSSAFPAPWTCGAARLLSSWLSSLFSESFFQGNCEADLSASAASTVSQHDLIRGKLSCQFGTLSKLMYARMSYDTGYILYCIPETGKNLCQISYLRYDTPAQATLVLSDVTSIEFIIQYLAKVNKIC